jgi:hypothetical protein
MANLKRITEAGLKSYQTAVQITRKTNPVRSLSVSESGEERYEDTGETVPNPNYALAVQRLEGAQYHYDTTRAIEAKAAKLKFSRNQYPGTDSTGSSVPAWAGFVRKEEGKWITYSWDQVIEILGIKIDGLPEIPAE